MLENGNRIYEWDNRWTKKVLLDVISSVPHDFNESKASRLPLIALKNLFLHESRREGFLYVDIEEISLIQDEDVDIEDAYINLTQADNLYQASLSATAKILGNSLLYYI